MTNYDQFRNKSIEEMANVIMCPNELGLAEIECDQSDDCNCYACCLGWLGEKVGGENLHLQE